MRNQKAFQFCDNRGFNRSLMKCLELIFVFFVACAVAQDVKVPRDLLDATTTVSNNVTDVEYEDDTTLGESTDQSHNETTFQPDTDPDEEIPPPDAIRDIRDREVLTRPPCSRQRCIFPSQCEVVPPFSEDCDPPRRIQPFPLFPLVSPTIQTKTHPVERHESILCPIGTVKNGSSCDVFNSNNCQEGYTLIKNRCVLSQTTCPLNFEWDGRSCIQRRICPNNHVWKSGRCVLPTPECPYGWEWTGEICQVSLVQCQPGSILRGEECVAESFTCPSGTILIGEDCVKPYPICLPGFILNNSTGFCTQIILRCPPGSEMVNGRCTSTVLTCSEGILVGNQCYDNRTSNQPNQFPKTTTPRPIVNIPTSHPRSRYCLEGFTLHNGLCYQCPHGYNLCNSKCSKNTECNEDNSGSNAFPPININIYTRDHGSSRPSPDYRGQGYNIVNNVSPINNTIVNINNITHPVTLNNFNENNIYIHTDVQCPDGSIKTVVVKNNESKNGCIDLERDKNDINIDVDHEDREFKEPEKCCEVVTPRQCKKRNENQWACSHKRHKYCGSFCKADRIYLKPSTTSFTNNVLTIAPSHPGSSAPPCFGRNCPPIGLSLVCKFMRKSYL